MNNHITLRVWIGIITIVLIFVLSSIILGSVYTTALDGVSAGVVSFMSYASSALVTIIYTVSIHRACHLHVPSLRPEIRKLNPRLIVAGFILILAIDVVLHPVMEIIPKIYQDIMVSYMDSGLWAMMAAVVLAPIFEEFIFRGVIQRSLMGRVGVIWGIVLSSLIFGVIHVLPQQVINATAVGLILGSIYYLTGSINTVIAIHFINNGFAYLIFMLFGSDFDLTNLVLGSGELHTVVYALSLILLILGMWNVLSVIRKRRKKVNKLVESQKNN